MSSIAASNTITATRQERCTLLPLFCRAGRREDGLPLLVRQVDGTVELHRFDGVCGLSPVGWRYCIWGADGTLTEDPSSCACACREGT
ncbi:hypothetical protein BE21_32325 [Sorangium cellulosum]|uniref:Uncharacterized protein n=1 Tax=Sorangium cellulosum TaxID=56 RepID=A0A150TQC4_SORCE|nr:hypothetical protein BE21_32325 [Sorangium cellulosum]